MRQDIAFEAEGTKLRGWLYAPEKAAGPAPAIVMAHGFSAVKEQYLDLFAERFCAAGFAVLVFDHRNFGASDGEPRQEADPIQQIRDYRDAITYMRGRDEVNADAVGVWGTSYSGGHVLVVGAIDRRVRCVVSQVPAVSGSATMRRFVRGDTRAGLAEAFEADRVARFGGAAPTLMPVVAEDPTAPCALPGYDSFTFFFGSRKRAPAFRNEVTMRSVEMIAEYEPGIYASMISPTPLMLIVADQDWITPTDLALEMYEQAREPKRLVFLKGGHFTPYVEHRDEACASAIDWFEQHLLATKRQM